MEVISIENVYCFNLTEFLEIVNIPHSFPSLHWEQPRILQEDVPQLKIPISSFVLLTGIYFLNAVNKWREKGLKGKVLWLSAFPNISRYPKNMEAHFPSTDRASGSVTASVIMEDKADLINAPLFLHELWACMIWFDKFFIIFFVISHPLQDAVPQFHVGIVR